MSASTPPRRSNDYVKVELEKPLCACTTEYLPRLISSPSPISPSVVQEQRIRLRARAQLRFGLLDGEVPHPESAPRSVRLLGCQCAQP